MLDVKLQDMKQRDEISGHEIAGQEIAGHENAKHENVRIGIYYDNNIAITRPTIRMSAFRALMSMIDIKARKADILIVGLAIASIDVN